MTNTPAPAAPQKDHGRAGRDLPAAITSGLLLGGVVLLSLLFWKTAFMLIVAIAMVVAIWEMHRGLAAKGIDLPEQPLMLGGAIMVVVAYFWGAPALVTATAVSALVIMLWLLRRGVDGYVKNATASVFTLIYLPFLASFVALLLSEGGNLPAFGLNTDDLGMRGVVTFITITVASDLGGYVAGVLFKRDLGIKDMSHIIPGHGGIMDRLDSLLATVAPIWLTLHYLVF